MASATIEKKLKKKEKEEQIQSKSLGNFHNLELLCKADDRQKKTLEKIIKQKPDLARSLNIYADGVKYYIARQQQRDKLLAGKDLPLMEVSEEQPQLTSLPLITNRQIPRQYKQDFFPPRLLSESLEKQNKRSINPNNYTPFANRQRVVIPSLNPPTKINKDRDLPKLKFNYYVGPGNNGELVKRILQKREQYWTAVPQTFQYKHFVWQQSYNGMDFNRLTQSESQFARVMYNFFEFHKNITSKTGLSQSLLQYYNNIEKTFDIIPLVFMLNFKNQDWMKDIQQFTEFYQTNNPLVQTTMKTTLEFDFYLSNLAEKVSTNSSQNQKDISTKVNYNGIKIYKMQDTLISKTQYLWLLKPADWNRGEGVHVFSTLEEVETLIKSYYYGKGNYECKEFVIQKYIERPLLLSGRKFDIRCWVLISQDMQYFLFKEAYIRTSGTAFSLDNILQEKKNSFFIQFQNTYQLKYDNYEIICTKNNYNLRIYYNSYLEVKNNIFVIYIQIYQQVNERFKKKYKIILRKQYIHLTNNAVQKNAQNYGQFEDGNQLSLKRFQQLLDQQETSYDFRKQGWPMIKNVVKITMNSTRLNKRNRKYGMQLLGYDFMIDENLKLWLIEVNANPCLEESSNLLKMLIPRMLDDAFKLTLDQVFTPEVDFGLWLPKYKVDEYEDQENMWESLGFCS